MHGTKKHQSLCAAALHKPKCLQKCLKLCEPSRATPELLLISPLQSAVHTSHLFTYLIYLLIAAYESGDVFHLWTECDAPQLPGEECVRPGEEFTCKATEGYPGDPTTTLYYYLESSTSGSMVSNGESSYTVDELGKFNLYCETTYRHECTEYFATCWANHSGVAFGE